MEHKEERRSQFDSYSNLRTSFSMKLDIQAQECLVMSLCRGFNTYKMKS